MPANWLPESVPAEAAPNTEVGDAIVAARQGPAAVWLSEKPEAEVEAVAAEPVPAVEPGKPAIDRSQQAGYVSGMYPIVQSVAIKHITGGKKGWWAFWEAALPTPVKQPARVSASFNVGAQVMQAPSARSEVNVSADGTKVHFKTPGEWSDAQGLLLVESSK